MRRLTSTIVVDASALVELLLGSPQGTRVAVAVAGNQMFAPDLINVETLFALRRLERRGGVTADRASVAVSRLIATPLRREPTLELIDTSWSLRHNLRPSDGCYVALARRLGCALVTADRRISSAPGLEIPVITV